MVAAQKAGIARGVASVCSAHPFVLEAVLRHGLVNNTPALIEATCNQVNQFGGYSGITPVDFVGFVGQIAERVNFPHSKLILGGDHLGPLVWSNEPAVVAMAKAKQLVREYALAGFAKIHLDCSMPCAGDGDLSIELMAQRTAELAREVENACSGAGLPLPRYVVGTEVPPAGGTKAGQHQLVITDPAQAARTIEQIQLAFSQAGLESAWKRVIALVVQPGVEFGDVTIHDYDRNAASELARFIETIPGLVYEAHSTDYQAQQALRALVEDHFAILKVGPGLTFALREAVFALGYIEKELFPPEECSHVPQALEEAAMLNPIHWQKYYRGNPQEQTFMLKFSLSDRLRYYWRDANVQKSLSHLLRHFKDTPIPLTLVSQFMPDIYPAVRAGVVPNRAQDLLLARIENILDDYQAACFGTEK
ncbi:MAG: tagatose-bisphosphate aldolase [Anaerolineales bacterium]|nr:tagatose-bisphosphate aldolase [Anaerolineae bacterium]PWB55153.1 MAG: tagatose-bisphosphate aldolase [Anaerolineales bacterium]